METQVNDIAIGGLTRSSVRIRVVSALAPLTVSAGLVWALVQPYRITLLHPHEGFWWLVVEPPLLVVIAGLFFGRVVARPLIDDLRGT